MPETIQIPRAWLEELFRLNKLSALEYCSAYDEENLYSHIESAKSLLE